MGQMDRRRFLRTITVVGAISGVAGIGSARSSTTTVRGRVVDHRGDPVQNRIVKNYGDSSFDVYTDSEGVFKADVESGSRLKLTLYKGNENTLIAPDKNEVPHVYTIGGFTVSGASSDLGDLQIPEAHLVRMQALDSDGNPVEGANPGVRHVGSGIGSYYMSTRSDGWAYIRNAEVDGIELAGDVKLSMEIPTDGGGSMVYRTEKTINEPRAFKFQVGDGITEVGSGSSQSDTEAQTNTPTESTTTGKEDSATTERTPTLTGSKQTSKTESQAKEMGTPTPTATSPTTPGMQRGFFSNNSSGDYGPLDDPFFLTVGGFALSVAGIIHNMVRGY